MHVFCGVALHFANLTFNRKIKVIDGTCNTNRCLFTYHDNIVLGRSRSIGSYVDIQRSVLWVATLSMQHCYASVFVFCLL
jgi:hypothetical protein